MGKYEDWKNEYYNLEKVDLNKYFSEDNFKTIKKLEIEVYDKIYTESEFENLYFNVASFYDADLDKPKEEIKEKDVSFEEYKNLLDKFKNINEKYDF